MKKYALLLTVLLSLTWIIPTYAEVPVTGFSPEKYQKLGCGTTVHTDTFTINGILGRQAHY